VGTNKRLKERPGRGGIISSEVAVKQAMYAALFEDSTFLLPPEPTTGVMRY
jgi:hypothetical protein